MKSIRPFVWLAFVGAFTTAASSPQCGSSVDPPLAPPESAYMTPLLISDSSLLLGGRIELDNPAVGDWHLQVLADMNRGLAQVAHEDKFLIRATVSFLKDESDLVGLQPCVDKPAPAKQDEFYTGKSVEVMVMVPLSTAVKDILLAADDSATGGSDPVGSVLLELLLSADNDRVLDAVTFSGAVNPKGD